MAYSNSTSNDNTVNVILEPSFQPSFQPAGCFQRVHPLQQPLLAPSLAPLQQQPVFYSIDTSGPSGPSGPLSVSPLVSLGAEDQEWKHDKKTFAEIAKQNQTVAGAYQGSCTISVHVPSFLSAIETRIDKPIRAKVTFVDATTEQAIMDAFQKNPYSSIAVLNFADRKTPGGLYLQGVRTQEEALCRAMPAFYSSLCHSGCYEFDYRSTLLWTPKSYFARNPQTRGFDFLPKPIAVSVVSMAAPDLTRGETFDMKNMKMMLSGVFTIPYVLKKCDTIILGAIGTAGPFRNDPTLVAKAFASPIKRCGHLYQRIIFAIPDKEKLKIFTKMLEKYVSKS